MSAPVKRPPARLKEHFAHTYFSLRSGIALLGIALPLALWVGGRLCCGEALQGSMSAYYHVGAMRDVFVGVLMAIGAGLYLYKGFSPGENLALNGAGLMAAGVALFPTTAPEAAGSLVSDLHQAFAIAFFLCIAYVCWFRASDTLSLIRDTERADRHRRIYKVQGALLVLLPLSVVVLALAFPEGRIARSVTFGVEACAVWVFASYWVAKSRELSRTDAESLAVEGKLARQEADARALPAGGRVVQTEVDLDDLAEDAAA